MSFTFEILCCCGGFFHNENDVTARIKRLSERSKKRGKRKRGRDQKRVEEGERERLRDGETKWSLAKRKRSPPLYALSFFIGPPLTIYNLIRAPS